MIAKSLSFLFGGRKVAVVRQLCLWSLLMLTCFYPLHAEDNPTSGELSLPWSEFQRLLKTSDSQIVLSWDEFQKLMKQTGDAEIPPVNVQGGNVVLSRDEFKKILSRMTPGPSETSKFFLTKGVYSVRVGNESSQVKALLQLHVVGKPADRSPLRIPLFPGNVPVEEILLNGRPAIVENDGSQLFLLVTEAGIHSISARFLAPSSLKKPPYQLSFGIPSTPITQLTVYLPVKNVELNVQGASDVVRRGLDGGTEIEAILPVTTHVMVSWNSVLPEAQKGPAKIYADVYNLITIEDDAMKLRTSLELDVIQNTINTVNVQVPEGYSVLDVEGDSVGDWKLQGEGERVLMVPFSYAKSGRVNLVVSAEKLFKEKNMAAGFDGFHVLKSVREKGFVGVELKTTAEVKTDTEGLDRVDIQEAPSSLLALASRPLLEAYKYLRQPFSLHLDVQRHEEVAVISTVVDEANGVTLLLEDGQRVHHLTFNVRNSWKQFLELSLPEGADVWGAFVEGERVRPSKNDQGRLLIPLNRSQTRNGDLSGFEVELTYHEKTKPVSVMGHQRMQFPMPDVVVSQMLWSVYLPSDHDYTYFGGNVDKEESASGLRPLLSVVGGGQDIVHQAEKETFKDYYSSGGHDDSARENRQSLVKQSRSWTSRGRFAEDKNVAEESYLRQMDQEFKFFNQVKAQAAQGGSAGNVGDAGVLPIRIKIPQTGKVFRFTKQMIVDQVPLSLSVCHLHHGFLVAFYWVLFSLVLFWGYRSRAILRRVMDKARLELNQNKGWIEYLKRADKVLLITFTAMIFGFFVDRFLGEVLLLVFLAAVMRWGILKIKANKAKTP